jgi:hypothetical protein
MQVEDRRLMVIVPSRGRPADVRRLVLAVAATRKALTTLVFCFDEDDPSVEANLAALHGNAFTYAHVGPRQTQVAWANAVALPATEHFQAIAMLADDNVPVTPGWDEAFLSVLADPGMLMTSANDLSGNAGRPTHVAMSAETIRTLGWIAEPSMRHYFVDNIWEIMGVVTSSYRWLPDVVIDHLWRPGRVPADPLRDEEMTSFDTDRLAFNAWLGARADADIEKLKGLLCR